MFDDDELLSMGQSKLVLIWGESCDMSIFLSGPKRRTCGGASMRALALYDVRRNEMGIKTKWPGGYPVFKFKGE